MSNMAAESSMEAVAAAVADPAPAIPAGQQGGEAKGAEAGDQGSSGQAEPAPAKNAKAQELYSDEDVQALNAKVEKDGYEPTQDELDKYRLWQQGRKKSGKAPVPEKGGEGAAQEGPGEPGDPVAEALKLVGAKEPGELAAKIKGLQQAMTSSGGKLGEENKALRQRLEGETAGFKALLSDVLAGKAEALEYAQRELGVQIPQKGQGATQAPAQASPDAEDIPDDVADVGTYRLLKAELKQMEAQLAKFQQASQSMLEKSAQEQAHSQWVEELGRVAADFPELAPKGADLGSLLREYWSSNDTDPVDPRLQPMVTLLEYARDNGISNLRHAHVVMNHDKWDKDRQAALLEAERRGAQKVSQHPPTVGLAGQRATGTTDTHYSPVSDTDLQAMLSGDRPIPESWRDDEGQFVRSRVPKNAWKLVFGD
jgi:hypothetical protein